MTSDQTTRELAEEYIGIDNDLKQLTSRKVTRKHKIGHSRQLQITRELQSRHPALAPNEVIDQYRST